ncbi:hypothetical protein T09_312 [Trichinella sp. T9]|nr:hypothetical protein T09_312 [Trichinella sp. T9]
MQKTRSTSKVHLATNNTCTNETRENYNVTAALVPQQMIEALMRAYSEETMTMLKIINFAFHNTDSMKG